MSAPTLYRHALAACTCVVEVRPVNSPEPKYETSQGASHASSH
jgi:hypothetical protein